MTAPGELLETSLQEIVLHGEAFAVAFSGSLPTKQNVQLDSDAPIWYPASGSEPFDLVIGQPLAMQ